MKSIRTNTANGLRTELQCEIMPGFHIIIWAAYKKGKPAQYYKGFKIKLTVVIQHTDVDYNVCSKAKWIICTLK